MRFACTTSFTFHLFKCRCRCPDMTPEDVKLATSHLSPLVSDTDDIGWEEVTDASLVELLKGPLAKSAQERAATVSLSETFSTCEKFKRHLEIFVDRVEACHGRLALSDV
jgi:PTHB1 C-terminus